MRISSSFLFMILDSPSVLLIYLKDVTNCLNSSGLIETDLSGPGINSEIVKCFSIIPAP